MATMQTQTYPENSALAAFLAANLVEDIPPLRTDDETGETVANDDFAADHQRLLWNLLHQTSPGRALAVIGTQNDTARVNVVGGWYEFDGQARNYVPGGAIDLAGGYTGSTARVWMGPDNTVGHGTDWPATRHLKLAEVLVNANDAVSEIRDCRLLLRTPTGVGVIVAKTGLGVGSAGGVLIGTVPGTDRQAVVTGVVLRNASADVSTLTFTLGGNATSYDDYTGAGAVSCPLDTADKAVLVTPTRDGATPAAQALYDSGAELWMAVGTAVSGATVDVDVLGYLV